MELTRWKLIAGSAALVGAAVGGIAAANAEDGFGLNDRGVISLSDDDTGNTDVVFDDGSPESADSPNESVDESADSPFDSPDDPGVVDSSPESTDSPNESAEDSPASAPTSTGSESADSANSADSADSPDSPDSADSGD